MTDPPSPALVQRQALVALGWVRRGATVLLVRRADPRLPAADGRWELPGGKLHFGETPVAAVTREVREETGYDVTVRALLPYIDSVVWDYPDHRLHVVLLVFECVAGPRRARPADPRVAEVAWRAPATIDPATTLPSVADFLTWWRLHPAAGLDQVGVEPGMSWQPGHR